METLPHTLEEEEKKKKVKDGVGKKNKNLATLKKKKSVIGNNCYRQFQVIMSGIMDF